MTLPAKRPADDNVFMLIGQLLEATKAASESIRSLNTDTRQNAATLLAIAQSLELTESNLSRLERLVCTGEHGVAESLVSRAVSNDTRISRTETQIIDIVADVRQIALRLDAADKHQFKVASVGNVLWYAAIVIFQLATLAATYFAGRQ